MFIPKYWVQYKQCFKLLEIADNPYNTLSFEQATIKRYGWSNVIQIEAVAHVKVRVEEADQR